MWSVPFVAARWLLAQSMSGRWGSLCHLSNSVWFECCPSLRLINDPFPLPTSALFHSMPSTTDVMPLSTVPIVAVVFDVGYLRRLIYESWLLSQRLRRVRHKSWALKLLRAYVCALKVVLCLSILCVMCCWCWWTIGPKVCLTNDVLPKANFVSIADLDSL